MKQFELTWEVGPAEDLATPPAEWVPAAVPGAVQLDWARAKDWPPVEWAGNSEDYLWMEQRYWHYRSRIPAVSLAAGERLFLVCGGVDYQFEIRIDGQVRHCQTGMYRPVELDLSQYAAGADLELVVFPVPGANSESLDRNNANRSFKPAVSFGWDFHPRLTPSGIWMPTYLEVRPAAHLARLDASYELANDFSEAILEVEAELTAAPSGHTLEYALTAPSGAAVTTDTLAPTEGQVQWQCRVAQPQLWWPNGYGTPTLYTLSVRLLDAAGAVVQEQTRKIGFRRVRLVMNEGAWDFPAWHSPKSRSYPPMTLEVNGERIFAKGSNWVSPDIFPGRLDRPVYESLLTLARDANLNLLRCWGGAVVQKDAFFELCDELGIMVWQEFTLACNCYDDDPAYLEVVDRESRYLIERLRRHPCLVLWCGGNELFNDWSGMHDQHLVLRLLNRNCLELDPERPFYPTMPVMGVGHGSYLFRLGDGREVYQYMRQAHCTAYTEFGSPGPAPLEIVERIIPEAERFPPQPGGAWEQRFAFLAWGGSDGSWLQLETIESYFGESQSLAQVVERGEWLQAEGYRCLFEESRRQKPFASMAVNWCFNEPWPCAANNSILAWPDTPKAGYSAVKAACRPTLASARFPKFAWAPGETLEFELWLLNDCLEAQTGVQVSVTIGVGDHQETVETWVADAIPANENVPGPTVQHQLGEDLAPGQAIAVELRVADRPEWSSSYRLWLSR